MLFRSSLAFVTLLASFFQLSSIIGAAQSLTPRCQPSVTPPIIVATHEQIVAAGRRAEPPLTDTKGFGFAWPDTQMGVIKTADGYEWFTSDGAFHPRQIWQGQWVGNNNYGSVTTTVGTLDNPLGTGNPQDVSISPNPDPAVNPNYSGYTYMGGGPVYQVPAGKPGAGNLLVGYHAELPSNTLYAVHGLAASWDNGQHWTDLGEVVRPNQSFAPELAPGFDEIGDGPLVMSPDGKYFYFYFPDWPAGTTTTTHVSVARALASSLLEAAFGPEHPHTVPFEKFYEGTWNLQPGISGASTDLNPNWAPQQGGYLDIHFDSALQRYVMIIDNDTTFYYAESVDGLTWTTPISLGDYADGVTTLAPYPRSVGLGDDPHILGKTFYVYYTFLHEENGGLPREGNSLRRFTLTCP
ncbi:MAG: hypothetical protein WAM78_10685 [Candidatus Sulfotelmatobacter sp.]